MWLSYNNNEKSWPRPEIIQTGSSYNAPIEHGACNGESSKIKNILIGYLSGIWNYIKSDNMIQGRTSAKQKESWIEIDRDRGNKADDQKYKNKMEST